MPTKRYRNRKQTFGEQLAELLERWTLAACVLLLIKYLIKISATVSTVYLNH